MLSLEKIRKIFEETKEISNNFRNLTYEVLTKQKTNSIIVPSQRIIVFRLALGLKRGNFAKSCKLNLKLSYS